MPDNVLTSAQRQRLVWIRLYEHERDAGLVCRRCGISRPTLRKWLARYQAQGVPGLLSGSRRPRHSPRQKAGPREIALILDLRRSRRRGIKRLRNELIRLHQLRLSLATLHKVLRRHGESRLAERRWRRRVPQRYNRPIPGDRVQMDVCKIAPGLYHYVAVDDCSRYRVLGLFPRRTAAHTIAFLERVLEEMPFPIPRVQTDRGREFFALRVQQWLKDAAIKFRPIRPASPHLNGKVERSHQTDWAEFYAIADRKAPDLPDQLALWQHAYNWDRPHSSLGGQTPVDRVCELSNRTPLREEVDAVYDEENEPVRHPEYAVDSALRKLKRSLWTPQALIAWHCEESLFVWTGESVQSVACLPRDIGAIRGLSTPWNPCHKWLGDPWIRGALGAVKEVAVEIVKSVARLPETPRIG